MAVVDKMVDRRGTRAVAQAYLDISSTATRARKSAPGTTIVRGSVVGGASMDRRFPKIKLFTVDQVFGGWQKAQKTHFADGGVFDQIYQPGSYRVSRARPVSSTILEASAMSRPAEQERTAQYPAGLRPDDGLSRSSILA